MMVSPKISVLVPIYNVELFLQRCIESVLTQSFSDWELILVDDGSSDRSGAICDSLTPNSSPSGERSISVSGDGKIKTIHKENGGLPSARLAGFKEAKGEYLVFLDADDWLLPDALRTLYAEIISGDFDIVKARPYRVDDCGIGKEEDYEIIEGEIQNSDEYKIDMIHNFISPYLHSGIYRKSLFSETVFERVIDHRISISEDWVTNLLISPNVNKVKIVNNHFYAYYVNPNSMMTTSLMSPYLIDTDMEAMSEIIEKCSAQVQNSFYLKKMIAYIGSFFVPEYPMLVHRYDAVTEYIENIDHWTSVKQSVRKNYLLFIRFRPLFLVYSRIYAFAYWIFKLHGKNRKICIV